ncbi:hypothetical protein LSAT2_011766 [Lamellibrachia satsuma]|nr:hypothetical protein LSAT2_011766 [Lamellibrachia satsuma]
MSCVITFIDSTHTKRRAEYIRVIFEGSMNVLYNSMQAADLLQQAVSAGQEIEDMYTKTRRTTIKAIINKALKIVDQMSTAVFNRKSPGEETVLQSKAFAVKLKRDMAYDLSNQTLVLPHSSNVVGVACEPIQLGCVFKQCDDSYHWTDCHH